MPIKIKGFDELFKFMGGAGYYEKLYGANAGEIKWFKKQPENQSEWKFVSSGTDITDAVEAIARSEKTSAENLFSTVVDTPAYNTQDYQRVRSFLRDWYASQRTLVTYQANISDVYQMPNDQLDDLFQSFGYGLSTSLRDPVTNNAPLNKVNFFLDLVNLYKIKGTPQALLSVLQYYGLNDIDIYTMSLQFEDRLSKDMTDLIFKGKVIAGTTGDTTPIYLPFEFLTQADPHWMQSESKIRQLFTQTNINFPSQTPYFAVKPLFDEEATDAATGILTRLIQDQHAVWETAGFPPEDTTPVLPQDAVVTITGDLCSALTLYLSCIYIFNRNYNVGSSASRFICYDGTSTDSTIILNEFRTITGMATSRADWLARWYAYLDQFSRAIGENFLQDHDDAETVLAILNPTVKANIDSLVESNSVILGTLLNDLGEWIRNNISYGFVNMSYILFGIDSLFAQLSNVINFFKPYRARLIPLESIQFSNRLFNSIVIEDSISFDVDFNFHDFITGDSEPCCTGDATTCIDTIASDPIYSREYFDCGSSFDIGAVVDEVLIEQEEIIADHFRCPAVDTTGFVVSEITSLTYGNSQQICDGTNIVSISVPGLTSSNYSIALSLRNENVSSSIYNYIVQNKTASGFQVLLSSPTDSANYYIEWDVTYDSTNAGVTNLIAAGSTEVTITLPSGFVCPAADYSVAVALVNNLDVTPSIYAYDIIDKTATSFKVRFSGPLDSPNYFIDWNVCSSGTTGYYNIPNGVSQVTIPVTGLTGNSYPLIANIVSEDSTSSSVYATIIRSKEVNQFTLELSGPTDSGNYYVSWMSPPFSIENTTEMTYYQSGGFRDFDEEGVFDCTHGFDLCFIEIEQITSLSGFLQQENEGYLTQENGGRLILYDYDISPCQ